MSANLISVGSVYTDGEDGSVTRIEKTEVLGSGDIHEVDCPNIRHSKLGLGSVQVLPWRFAALNGSGRGENRRKSTNHVRYQG